MSTSTSGRLGRGLRGLGGKAAARAHRHLLRRYSPRRIGPARGLAFDPGRHAHRHAPAASPAREITTGRPEACSRPGHCRPASNPSARVRADDVLAPAGGVLTMSAAATGLRATNAREATMRGGRGHPRGTSAAAMWPAPTALRDTPLVHQSRRPSPPVTSPSSTTPRRSPRPSTVIRRRGTRFTVPLLGTARRRRRQPVWVVELALRPSGLGRSPTPTPTKDIHPPERGGRHVGSIPRRPPSSTRLWAAHVETGTGEVTRTSPEHCSSDHILLIDELPLDAYQNRLRPPRPGARDAKRSATINTQRRHRLVAKGHRNRRAATLAPASLPEAGETPTAEAVTPRPRRDGPEPGQPHPPPRGDG